MTQTQPNVIKDNAPNAVFKSITAFICLALGITSLNAASVTYGGIEFPSGDISFADLTISWDPLANGGPAPTGSQNEFIEPIGPPDAPPITTNSLAATSLTLGRGGVKEEVTLKILSWM